MSEAMLMTVVASACEPAKAEAFNRWYTEVHVPLLMKYKGIKRAARYQRAGDGPGTPEYLAFYEFESEQALADFQSSPEFGAAMQEMQQSWPDGLDIKWAANYEPIKTWE